MTTASSSRGIAAGSSPVPLAKCLDETAQWVRAHGREDDVLATGLSELDHILDGGVARGAVTVIASRPSMGKTALAWQIAEYVASTGVGVLYISPNQSRHMLCRLRLMSMAATSVHSLEQLCELSQADEIRMELSDLRSLPLLVDDTSAFSSSLIRDHAASAVETLNEQAPLGLIVVDDLHCLRANAGVDHVPSIVACEAMEVLGSLAHDLGIAVLANVSVSREAEDRPPCIPALRHIWGEGVVDDLADVVIALYREDYYCYKAPMEGTALLKVLKNRFGDALQCTLRFDGAERRFSSFF